MKLKFLSFRCLALALLLLSSCMKNQEEPAPTALNQSTSINQVDTHSLQQMFLDRHYAEQLVEPLLIGSASAIWTWTPLWEQAIKKDRSGTTTYVYIPLEPRQSVAPHAVNLLGAKKYLRFQHTDNHWSGSVRTYYYTVPKGELRMPLNVSSAEEFLATFSGDVFTKQVETGETTHSTYRNGAWQQPSSRRAPSSGATAANTCTAYYYCSWYLSCPPGWGPGITLGTISAGMCEVPDGYTLSCGYNTQYDLQSSQFSHNVCESGGDDPGNGGGNGGSLPLPLHLPCPNDPLVRMNLAPTPLGYIGATWGYTRNSGRKFHNGTDVFAFPGTHVFAAQGGVVTRVVSSFSPGEYKEDSYGNYIEIQSVINGQVVFLKYNHLDDVNGGLPVGASVPEGVWLGNTGTTGNAASPNVIPHLHLQASDANSQPVDPQSYIDTQFNTTTGQGNRPC